MAKLTGQLTKALCCLALAVACWAVPLPGVHGSMAHADELPEPVDTLEEADPEPAPPSPSAPTSDANSPHGLNDGPAKTTTAGVLRPMPRPNVAPEPSIQGWPQFTNRWGGRGLYRLDGAHVPYPGAITLAVGAAFFYTHDFFRFGDTESFNEERLYLSWSPVRHVEVGMSEGLINNSWKNLFVPKNRWLLGNPQFVAKGAWALRDTLPWRPGVGLRLEATVPVSMGNNGLAAKGTSLTFTGLASARPKDNLEVVLNVGYVWDNSKQVAIPELLEPDDRFVFNVNPGSALVAGLGIGAELMHLPAVVLGPFAEVTGRFGQNQRLGGNPLRLTAGVKGRLTDLRAVELMLGADARLSGAPQDGGNTPGVAPWTVFLQASAHIFDTPKRTMVQFEACSTDAQCPEGQSCRGEICVFTTEVVHEVVREVAQDTFTVAGVVLDQQTGRPVQDAMVTVLGFEKTPITVDYKTGAFHSFPLACGEGLVQLRVTAPNYRPFTTAMPRSTHSDERKLSVSMSRTDTPAVGRLQGIVKDAHHGKPVHKATIFIIALGQKFQTDQAGAFNAEVHIGRYDIVVSAKGYISQRKKLTIHEGDVIILNVDLTRLGQDG